MQGFMMLVAALGTYLGLLVTTTVADPNPPQLDPLSILPTLRRQKRDWIWNQMHIDEEKNTSLPHYVGKVRLRLLPGKPSTAGHSDGTGGKDGVDTREVREVRTTMVTAEKVEMVDLADMVVVVVVVVVTQQCECMMPQNCTLKNS
jgi:cadherin 5 type 2 (VE-cadherin)